MASAASSHSRTAAGSEPVTDAGENRQWLRGQPLEGALWRLGNRLPILWQGTVLDGELVADRIVGAGHSVNQLSPEFQIRPAILVPLAIQRRERPDESRPKQERRLARLQP